MAENRKTQCPECAEPALGRRDFLQSVGGTAVTLVGLEAVGTVSGHGTVMAQDAAPAAPRAAKPAEALVRELYQGLTAEQRGRVVLPYDHGAAANQAATRLRIYNAAIFNDRTVGGVYTRPQQELVGRILRSIAADEEGYRRLTRNHTYDGSGSLQNCGAYIFGDPTGETPYAWVFTGHHLTIRCDGNDPSAAWGGPMYYGHSPDGYSQRNVFYYQTRSVLSLFDSLNEQQRGRAVITGSPGEGANSVRHRREGFPGVPASDLTADQRRLAETVMRDVLSPYRREDADEVMNILRRNGGLERIHIAFYRDRDATDNNRWHFWRLEGPGFVWNYRVLPHVHTFVNIAAQAMA